MDPIGAVGSVSDKPSQIQLDAPAAEQSSQVVAQMAPPQAEPGKVSLGTQLWAGLDSLSVQMKELSEASRIRPPEPSGGDLASVMRESWETQAQMMEMQMKINKSQGVFGVALGMVQATQHGVQTLFQDK